jgi:hypothetical protein
VDNLPGVRVVGFDENVVVFAPTRTSNTPGPNLLVTATVRT